MFHKTKTLLKLKIIISLKDRSYFLFNAKYFDAKITQLYIILHSNIGAGINLILILIFNWIYEQVAYWLTEKELR